MIGVTIAVVIRAIMLGLYPISASVVYVLVNAQWKLISELYALVFSIGNDQ